VGAAVDPVGSEPVDHDVAFEHRPHRRPDTRQSQLDPRLLREADDLAHSVGSLGVDEVDAGKVQHRPRDVLRQPLGPDPVLKGIRRREAARTRKSRSLIRVTPATNVAMSPPDTPAVRTAAPATAASPELGPIEIWRQLPKTA